MAGQSELTAPTLREALTLGIPLTRALQNGRLGSFYALVNVTINVADTALTIALSRVPSCYIVVRNGPGGIVYDGTNLGTDWTGAKIVLRATVAGKYSLLVG